jgi:hypothetical protein
MTVKLRIPAEFIKSVWMKSYWLLVAVTGWYRTTCPMHCGHFSDLLCVPVWVLIIPHSSTRALIAAETSTSEAGSWREMYSNLADEASVPYSTGIFNIPYNLATWCRRLILLRRKSCYGYVSRLKIHHSRLCLNPRTLGPVAHTMTTRPLITTNEITFVLYSHNCIQS